MQAFYSYIKGSVSGEYHVYQFIALHSCNYLQKTLIKINVATDKGKQPKWNVTLNKPWNLSSWTKMALSSSWTHGLIAQWVSSLNGIQWSWVQIPLIPTFYRYFEKPVREEYHMHQLIALQSCDYLRKTSIRINVATDECKQQKLNVTLNKRWNRSSYTKFPMSVSWNHGLIAQTVRVSEQNSVVVGWNLNQANFL